MTRMIAPQLVVSVLLLGSALTGCSRATTLYLGDADVIPLQEGDTFTAPEDGAFYTEWAEKHIMETKRLERTQ